MPIDALYNAIRNAPNQQGWQAAQQREAASHQAAIDEAVAREQAAQQAAQLWNGYDYNAEAERRAQVGGFDASKATQQVDPLVSAMYYAQQNIPNVRWQGDPQQMGQQYAMLPGTETPANSERGRAITNINAQESVARTVRDAVNPFDFSNTPRGMMATPDRIKAYNEASDVINGADAARERIMGYNTDEEYRAAQDAQRKAGEDRLRQSALDTTQAAVQLDELRQRKAALEEQLAPVRAARNLGGGEVVSASGNSAYWERVQNELDRVDEAIRQYETDIAAADKYRRLESYNRVAYAQDFAANNKYRKTYGDDDVKQYGLAGENKLIDIDENAKLYEIINGNGEIRAERLQTLQNAGGGGLGGAATAAIVNAQDPLQVAKYMSNREKETFNYLYNTQGGEAARDYYELLVADLNARYTAAEAQRWDKEAKASPVGASITSIAAAPMRGLSLVGQVADVLANDSVDQNDPYNTFVRTPTAIRTSISKDLERKYGKGEAEIYNTIMNTADNVYLALLSGVYTAGAGAASSVAAKAMANEATNVLLGIMSTGAAADAVISAKERGLSGEQAVAFGLICGTIEALTEKVGMDAFVDALYGGKGALAALAKSVLAEGLEEGVGDFLTAAADVAVNNADAEYIQRMRQLRLQGASESQAASQAFGELLKEAGADTLRGAASALLMTGSAQVVTNSYNAARNSAPSANIFSQQYNENALNEAYLNPDEGRQWQYGSDILAEQERQERRARAEERRNARTAQTAAVPSETPANPAVPAPTAPQTANDTAEPTRTETPIQNGENGDVLWTHPSDNSGWKEQYNGDNPTYDALRLVDPEMFEAFLAEGVEGNTNTPIINAYVSAYNDVRQGTISPMAAATLLSDAYNEGGPAALAALYNPSTSNLISSALETAKQIDARHDAPAHGNTAQTLGNTVGSAETGFNYTEFPHETKVSRQAETTERYDPTKGRAAGQTEREWRKSLEYKTQSDAEVDEKAAEAIEYAQSYEGGMGQLMDDLRYTPGWNAVEMEVAKRIERQLKRDSIEIRREYGKNSEETKKAQTEYREWRDMVAEEARGVARTLQKLTDWSGEGNEDGSRTERAAVRAIENNDNLSDVQKAELTETVQNYMDDVRLVDEDVKDGSISEDEGKQSLIDIIVDVGRRRGTLANGVITRLVTANLSTLTFDELKQAAFAESGMLAFDKTAADPWQIVKTVQVLNMLSNPKTFATNVLSNTAFRGIDKLAMRGAALMDALLEKATGTRSVAWEDVVSRRIWDEVRHAAAKSIVEIALDIDMGGEGKYSPTGTQNFRAQGGEAALPVRAMRIWERNNNFALVLPDEIAKAHTRGSVARSMEKLTQEGRIRSKDVEHYAQNYADNLAEYRTFQNTRLASDITKGLHDAFNLISLSTIQQRNAAAERGEKLKFKDIDPAKFGLGDLIAPFSKIGGNLVGVALDYSPVKFLTGIAQTIELLAQQHRANVNHTEGVSAEQQARAVSNLGRGFTGTALSLGLYILAKAGLIRRGKDEDPTLTSQQKSAVNSLNKAEGRTGTQINMTALGRWLSGKGGDWQDGDKLYDLSRFEPFNFFVDYALMLADNWDEADDFVSYVGGATQAVLDTMGNNVSDMPVFQSLSNFNNARSYGDKWYQAAISSLGKTAVSSSTPNILAAFAKGMDDKQRDLYTHQAEGTDLLNILAASALETFDYAKSRIPFLRETLPTKVGTDGKPLTNPGNTAQRLLNAMLNPLGTNTLQQSDASAVLEQIRNATGDASFYPKVRTSTKSLEYTEKGEKHTIPLDYEQRQAFQEAYSTAYWDVANAMVKLPEFKRLAPEEQAKALGKLEKYAYQKAKQPYVGDKHVDKWVRNASKNTASLARWLVANR